MKRLIQRGLMFGNLIHIDSPVLIDRYNRALTHLTGRKTELTDFHIDISGYSPEIGDELGDHLYLNHGGVNRQFILLTTEQKRAPLLNAKFSVNRDILRDFITDNETQLFALTATDAVAGELVNSVFAISDPARLFDIRKITIDADTTTGTLQHARALGDLVDRFKTKEDAWFDDALIQDMIDLSGKTGDLTRNPIQLTTREFEQRNFWTAHFGGMYLFQDVDHPAVIATDKARVGELPVKYVFDLGQRNRIAKFLDYNDLAEPIIKARGVDGAAILRQKMDFILIDVAANVGADLTGLDRHAMRRLARTHADMLPEEYRALDRLLNWAQSGGKWPRIDSDHPAYFYAIRAADTPDKDLVNMLLAQLCPLDFRQMFICHKALFYDTYADWPEAKKEIVAEVLQSEYLMDKAGARAALFGHEPDMENASPNDGLREDMISRVGPWGAVRRSS